MGTVWPTGRDSERRGDDRWFSRDLGLVLTSESRSCRLLRPRELFLVLEARPRDVLVFGALLRAGSGTHGCTHLPLEGKHIFEITQLLNNIIQLYSNCFIELCDAPPRRTPKSRTARRNPPGGRQVNTHCLMPEAVILYSADECEIPSICALLQAKEDLLGLGCPLSYLRTQDEDFPELALKDLPRHKVRLRFLLQSLS